MFGKRTKNSQSSSEDNPFILSFSDMMAGLLAIFILVLISTMVELKKRMDQTEKARSLYLSDAQRREELKKLREGEKSLRKDQLEFQKQRERLLKELIANLQEIDRINGQIDSLLQIVKNREKTLLQMLTDIKNELKQRQITVELAENGSVLRIPEGGLSFELGKHEIAENLKQNAQTIGLVLLNALKNPKNTSHLDTIFIEGHTDSVANSRQMGNWGLSTYRAISLWNYWTQDNPELEELKNLKNHPTEKDRVPRPLFSVSGYSDTRSTHEIITDAMPNNRNEDRRIDIRFTLASSDKKNLGKLQKELDNLKKKTKEMIDKIPKTQMK